MNALRSIFCTFALLFLFPLCSFAGAADLTFSFRKASVSLDENYRNNDSSFSRLDDALSSGKLLRVTLRSYSSPDGSLAANKRISSKRAAAVKDEILSRNPELAESSFRIVDGGEDWKGVERILRTMNYEWKDEALEIIRSSNENKKQLLQELYVGEAWEVLLKSVFPRLRRVDVSFIYALGEGEHKFDLRFPSGIGWISENYADNSSTVSSLRSLVASSPDTIYIKSFASIDGSTSSNERLCKKRANSVKSFLVSEGYDASRIVILNIGEDWDGLKESVRNSNLEDKDEILGILEDSSLSLSQMKRSLQQLDGGRSWKRLLSGVMPQLRRVLVQ